MNTRTNKRINELMNDGINYKKYKNEQMNARFIRNERENK